MNHTRTFLLVALLCIVEGSFTLTTTMRCVSNDDLLPRLSTPTTGYWALAPVTPLKFTINCKDQTSQ